MTRDTEDPGNDAFGAGEIVLNVPEAAGGIRLDRFLADGLSGLSRNRLQAMIKEGRIRTESGMTVYDASARVKPGDRYAVALPEPVPALPEPQEIPLTVVYEDDHLIVVDKPAGMVVHPAPGNRDGTLVNALLHHCGKSLQGIGGVLRPGIIHRIDKDTSGLLVAAKSARAHAGLAALFADRAIDRLYAAVVVGVPEPMRGTVDRNIGRHPTNRVRFAAVGGDRGKPAITHYRVLGQSDLSVARIECRIETGRTHQIRVHMASLGHPLVGDPLYGRTRRTRRAVPSTQKRQAINAFPRQALHARTLGFVHPVTGKTLHFEAPLPADLSGLLTALALDHQA